MIWEKLLTQVFYICFFFLCIDIRLIEIIDSLGGPLPSHGSRPLETLAVICKSASLLLLNWGTVWWWRWILHIFTIIILFLSVLKHLITIVSWSLRPRRVWLRLKVGMISFFKLGLDPRPDRIFLLNYMVLFLSLLLQIRLHRRPWIGVIRLICEIGLCVGPIEGSD